MEKIIFLGLIIPIFIFVLYLGARAIRTGFGAKNSSGSDLKIENVEETEDTLNNPLILSDELDKLNELLKSGVLTQEEFEKAKKKLLDN